MSNQRAFYLSGKDYLTQQEAAHYCGVSISHFRSEAKRYGIRPFNFMGKWQYRRSDLRAAMEHAAHGEWPALP